MYVYIKTAMHWFQFPQIQELTLLTFTGFIWQSYSFTAHSVLSIILTIILFAYMNKDLSLWWIFSYLVLLIGGEWTIFNDFLSMANKYIRTYKHISKEWKISFCRLGKSDHCNYLNLFCTCSIWLFTAFTQINTSNIQRITCVETLLGNGISSSILEWKIKWI